MFQFSDQHIEEYQTQGFTIFREIVPAKLIDELRHECDRGAEAARERNGVNVQRFQPISAFPVDPKPFEEFRNLDAIRDAVSRLIPLPWEFSDTDTTGVLLEPAQDAWCTAWHRDWRDNVQGVDIADWEAQYKNPELFNQVNCALYEDSCTWAVPGSHLRPDTDAEVARFPTRPIEKPELDGLSPAEREVACLEYCQSMPGAQRLFLNAGDYCLYRNTLWHLGNYIPYRKRATIHTSVRTQSFHDWIANARKAAGERIAQGITWENPNAARLPVTA